MAEGTQQHPLKIYFFVWILLFVLKCILILGRLVWISRLSTLGLNLIIYDA